MNNKSAKILGITLCSIVGLALTALLVYEVGFKAGLFFIIPSLFSKSYNDDQPFSKNGLFVYENQEDNLDIQKLSISIKEQQDNESYAATFKNSLKTNYGINLEIVRSDVVVTDYSLKFTEKKKTLRAPKHYTYMYYFSLQISEKKYVFDIESQGEECIIFSFKEPTLTKQVNLYNTITN